MNIIIGAANAGLGRYDGLLSAIPNTHILLSPLITQEAVLSSKIEGTQVTMGEVLEIEASGGSSNIAQPKRDDAEEVLNYRRALQVCAAEMEHRPLSQHLLSAIHKLLMEGVRGRDKAPGIYRKEQNWIGPRGCAIENASFIPVAPEHLQQAMDDWERYLNITAELDALVQLAVLHVEFEAIHPFKDGNGRLGRMLIPLFLYQRKLLGSPNFYMSAYLEANREEYQEKLRAVSREGNWTEWCEFFLRGIQQQAAENERKARAILALYDRVKKQVSDWTHSQYSIKAVDFIFKSTIFSAPQFTGHSSIPRPTAARILGILKDRGLLVPLRQGKGGRAGIFVFRDLFNIAEGRDVF
ncbi:MAG TPA: Fic/DOC family N-terminal domain-containing protein [Smithellaceae bacterium]|nr:Fic family protein [Smithella sp.]HQG81729.1 Fic/DOC family N-terminal domain-containing protein [Smithellaceae bacterium]